MILSECFGDPIMLDQPSSTFLRVLKVEDIGEGYIQGMNDKVVQEHLSLGGEIKKSDLEDFVRSNLKTNDSVLFGLFMGHEHFGNLRLHKFDGKSISLGLALFDKEKWGQGWGTKMIVAGVDIAENKLGCDWIQAGVEHQNHGSRRAFEKAGFSLFASNDDCLIFRRFFHTD